MKKDGAILGLLVISILLISVISFVSAGLLGDTWNKITGKLTDGNEIATCTDSDGGMDYYVAGESCLNGVCYLEGCHLDGSLSETYCEGGEIKTERYDCSHGCSDGACVQKIEEGCLCEGYHDWSYDGTCDPDDCYLCPDCLKVIKVENDRTATWGKENSGGFPTTLKLTDFDQSTQKARFERCCESGSGMQIYDRWFSENDCLVEGGVYCRVIVKDIIVYDTYVDVILESPSTKDEINLRHYIYKKEEPEPVLEICSKLLIQGDIGNYKYYESGYDSGPPEYSKDGKQIGTVKCCEAYYQGLDNKNYVAYVCPYDNRQDAENSLKWMAKKERYVLEEFLGQRVYRPDVQAIIWINSNYILAAVNEGATDVVPEAIAEAYLKKYYSDLGVPTVEAEEERPIPIPVPCGIGSCVPEEEVEEVEVIPEEKIFYKCNGCELEGKCYLMGYRKEGKYCSDNYEFTNQIEEGMCDNNFECKSNICISGECVGEGLMKKIINWFKKLFGIEEEEGESGLEICSKLLIEKNIGGYEYNQSVYGLFKEAQAPLISDEGEQIGIIKCCVAQYLDENEKRGMALVCPYDNREYVENLIKIGLEQSPGARFIIEDYKGEKVYVDKWISMVWTHDKYAIATGRDHQQEGSVFPEDIADAYLKKYPNDLG